MNQVTITISKDTYDFLRHLCEEMNKGEFEVSYPYYCVDTTELMAVPPYEGDEREFIYKGNTVLGKDVLKFCNEHKLDIADFMKDANHLCDLKGVEVFKGFFLTRNSCEEYIDVNIKDLPQPYAYKKSLVDNPEMIKVVRALYEVTGVTPQKAWLSEDERKKPVDIIEENIRAHAKEAGYVVNEKAIKGIAKAKNMMFGVDNWEKCPCASTDGLTRYCGSEVCAHEVETNGKCHCNCYHKKVVE